MKNKLYLVATPIGNLEEMTALGKRILLESAVIFCEDTRVTGKLLTLLNIRNNQKLLKLDRFNESASLELVISELKKHSCALVSDAGYPIISDPGYFVVKGLRALNIPVQVVNGPCALIHAIVGSGIDSRKIFFAGFLTKKYLSRKKELQNLKFILNMSTLVYYESKNFLLSGMDILREVFGDIYICVCRELSKLNEEFYYDTITNIQKKIVVKGEFVVIVPRQDEIVDDSSDLMQILKDINRELTLENSSHTLKELCRKKSTSKYTNKDIYTAYVREYKR